MCKTLHLTLKKKWFDMILSGEKKQEYREIKRFWCRRFFNNTFYKGGEIELIKKINKDPANRIDVVFNKFDVIVFKNGYAKNAPEIKIECLGIEIGKAIPEWSDNWQGDVFVIKIGEIIKTKNTANEIDK